MPHPTRGSYTSTCRECGADFEGFNRGPRKQYCSTVCRKAGNARAASEAHRATYVPVSYHLVCAACAAPFEAQRSNNRYCSNLCRSRAYNAARKADGRLAAQAKSASHREWNRAAQAAGRYRDVRACEACGEAFECASRHDTRTCGRGACKAWLISGRWPQSRIPWVTCPGCGSHRIDRTGGATRCETCRAKATGRKWIGKVLRRQVYERDGWICQLCTEPVDPDADPHGDWGASLDHIVPRACGGDHSLDNLRLAHRWCNSVRGDDTRYTAADLVA